MRVLAVAAAAAFLFCGCQNRDAAVTAAASPEPLAQEKSPYVGRWYSRWSEPVGGIGTVTTDEHLTIRDDGTATREFVSTIGLGDPKKKSMNFRWDKSSEQFTAHRVDQKFANENGDDPDIVGIIRSDGRLSATLLWWTEPTVTYDRVPMLPGDDDIGR